MNAQPSTSLNHAVEKKLYMKKVREMLNDKFRKYSFIHDTISEQLLAYSCYYHLVCVSKIVDLKDKVSFTNDSWDHPFISLESPTIPTIQMLGP